MEQDRIDKAATMLRDARKTGSRLKSLPLGLQPVSSADGYRIQSSLVLRSGEPSAGWKIGATSEQAQTILSIDEPFTGVVFQRNVHEQPADLSSTGIKEVFAEAEYIFRLSAVAAEDLLIAGRIHEAVQSVHLGIELCETAFTNIVGPGANSLIADNGLAAHVVLGPALEHSSWHAMEFASVALTVNGLCKGSGSGSLVLGSPFKTLEWLSRHLAATGQGIPAGALVVSGSCTGMTKVGAGDLIEAHFADLGTVSVHL